MRKQQKRFTIVALLLIMPVALLWLVYFESHSAGFDADYVGSEVCGGCHTQIHPEWQRSPHANMTRKPSEETVVGDFSDGSWMLPQEARRPEVDDQPAAKMYRRDGRYTMALRHPVSNEYVPFEIEHVIGYQYRQVYVTLEAGGVLRRLPLQWSTRRQEFFPYWNLQEGSTPTLEDLWQQMGSLNSRLEPVLRTLSHNSSDDQPQERCAYHC